MICQIVDNVGTFVNNFDISYKEPVDCKLTHETVQLN